ncbi:MAG: type I-MYXAN CRISPR-associated protein Cas6/Cmx6 [Acidobacteria bacterium]|nr:type I-MYXAN CRISPR-associated protein Cas6/Cmx6 [Acidobacteriota bacterium]
MSQHPYINVGFALSGKQLPADQGYLLYSAISKASAALHGIDWLAIELISGFPSGRGLITLPERDATLHLRIPADHYRDVLRLVGKRLDIGGHQIRLGLPVARPLEPAPSLYARVVTIKKFTEPEPFLEAVKESSINSVSKAPSNCYSFDMNAKGDVTFPALVQKVKDGDIDAKELFIGGSIVHSLGEETKKALAGATISNGGAAGVKTAAEAVKEKLERILVSRRERNGISRIVCIRSENSLARKEESARAWTWRKSAT